LIWGAGAAADPGLGELEDALGLHDIAAAEAGGLDDLNTAADVVYGRTKGTP
jgi:hypothetical protein